MYVPFPPPLHANSLGKPCYFVLFVRGGQRLRFVFCLFLSPSVGFLFVIGVRLAFFVVCVCVICCIERTVWILKRLYDSEAFAVLCVCIVYVYVCRRPSDCGGGGGGALCCVLFSDSMVGFERFVAAC